MTGDDPWWTPLGVFLAGGTGALLRVALSATVESRLGERLPHVGVLTANLVGCLLIGACAATIPVGPWRTIILGGLLGGFTTYSAFALFKADLLASGRYDLFGIQLGLHLVGGLLAVVGGMQLMRLFGLAVE